jgi:hypothetical protein
MTGKQSLYYHQTAQSPYAAPAFDVGHELHLMLWGTPALEISLRPDIH